MKVYVAKLFQNGGSQAVRIPSELRFEGHEVYIRKDLVSGDLIISGEQPGSLAKLRALQELYPLPEADWLQRPSNVETPMNDLFGDIK
jgi:antitoxin VapB